MNLPELPDPEALVAWAFISAFVGAMLLGAVGLIGTMAADGKIDYCQVHHYRGQYGDSRYVVEGHRPWRTDITIAVTDSAEDAADKLQQLCPAP